MQWNRTGEAVFLPSPKRLRTHGRSTVTSSVSSFTSAQVRAIISSGAIRCFPPTGPLTISYRKLSKQCLKLFRTENVFLAQRL